MFPKTNSYDQDLKNNLLDDCVANSMSLLQVQPTSLIHKIVTDIPNRANSLENPFIAYLYLWKHSVGQMYAISMKI